MKWVVRSLLTLIAALFLIPAGWGTFLWISAHRAVPIAEGDFAVEGLRDAVTISRDERGIPHISASNEADAYFGLGYVHAQDRLFAMELMRRQGQGRLAEIIGPPALGADKYARTLGLYRRAQADLAGLAPDVKRITESYAAGVNAWINSGHPLPVEYKLLMFEPEPWKAADSIVWQKLMGLRLSGNWDQELAEALLVEKLGAEQASELWPNPESGDHTTLQYSAALYRDLPLQRLLDGLTGFIQPTLASNVWVLSGERTETGSPILASDPHLGFQAP
ncbi:MAG: penicillin acylase family protein, partial [Rhodospirillaceae bacterium]